jgi:hypothetical protein
MKGLMCQEGNHKISKSFDSSFLGSTDECKDQKDSTYISHHDFEPLPCAVFRPRHRKPLRDR